MPLQRHTSQHNRFGERRRGKRGDRDAHRLRMGGRKPGSLDCATRERERYPFSSSDTHRRGKPWNSCADRCRDDRSTDRHDSTGCAQTQYGSDTFANPDAGTLRVQRRADEQQCWRGRIDGNDPRDGGIRLRVDGDRDRELAHGHVGRIRQR